MPPMPSIADPSSVVRMEPSGCNHVTKYWVRNGRKFWGAAERFKTRPESIGVASGLSAVAQLGLLEFREISHLLCENRTAKQTARARPKQESDIMNPDLPGFTECPAKSLIYAKKRLLVIYA